jgi:hypothetical protein
MTSTQPTPPAPIADQVSGALLKETDGTSLEALLPGSLVTAKVRPLVRIQDRLWAFKLDAVRSWPPVLACYPLHVNVPPHS